MNRIVKVLAIVLTALVLAPAVALNGTVVNAQSSTSQNPAPATQWQKVYGTEWATQVSNLIQTSDGGYAFLQCGSIGQSGEFFPSILYKVDSSGNMQWNKTFNLFSASSLIQTSDGGYEISGQMAKSMTFQSTPTLIKLNSKGDTQWQENTTTVLNLAVISSNIQTSDGGYAYFKPAKATEFPTDAAFPKLVKTDSDNNTQWIENLTYSGPLNFYNGSITFPFKIFSLIETSDGALAGLGIADPGLNGGIEGYIYLIKTAPFLPLPSQSALPTPLPSPTPAPFRIAVNEQTLIITVVAAAVALSTVALIYMRHRKTVQRRGQP